jgi:hypothetical protein
MSFQGQSNSCISTFHLRLTSRKVNRMIDLLNSNWKALNFNELARVSFAVLDNFFQKKKQIIKNLHSKAFAHENNENIFSRALRSLLLSRNYHKKSKSTMTMSRTFPWSFLLTISAITQEVHDQRVTLALSSSNTFCSVTTNHVFVARKSFSMGQWKVFFSPLSSRENIIDRRANFIRGHLSSLGRVCRFWYT